MKIEKITGSIVALITPMANDGSLDDAALKNLVDFHIQSGTRAIVAVGTTGESATLNHDEHIEVIEKIIIYADGKIPIIAGTGANATSEAIALTRDAKTVGADAALLVTPYYNKPTQEGLYQHYKAVAEAVEIPQILYNVPSRTAVDLAPPTVARLAEVDNIIGIKDATGDLAVGAEIARLCADDFCRYSGDDATAVAFILEGGDGGISVTANVAPAQVAEAYRCALEKDEKSARTADALVADLHRSLFFESNPIPVKWALHRMGKCAPGIRLPLTVLSAAGQAVVEKDLLKLGVI